MVIKRKEVRVFSRYLRMSPHKVRRILDQIRGRTYDEVLLILEFMPYRACSPILKLIWSGAANVQYRFGVPKSSVFVSEARVDKGPILKRFRPRAQGRGFPIRKPTCHVILTLRHRSLLDIFSTNY